MLLEREDVTPNTTDTDGRTPLLWAAGKGHAGIVRMLLEREDVTPDTVDKVGRTPLSWAAGHGCEGNVKMLLERQDVTPDTTDNGGRTPLSWAVERGHTTIVDILQEQRSVGLTMAMTGLTDQTALTRRFENQGSGSQPAGRNSSTHLSPAAPSETSQHPSKRVRRSRNSRQNLLNRKTIFCLVVSHCCAANLRT